MKACLKPQRPLGRRLAFESLENRMLLAIWSGYAVTASTNTVTSVHGAWTVPTVTSPAPSFTSQWVGIDGYGTSTVEQTGTASYVNSNGTSGYYAWWEMYPNPVQVITSMTVRPGDRMSATVSYVSSGTHAGQFLLQLANMTRSTTFSTYQSQVSGHPASRSTADWVVEAPTNIFSNFGSVTFTSCSATISGVTAAIDHWSYHKLQPTHTVVSALTRDSSTSDWFAVSYTASTSSVALAAAALPSSSVDATLDATPMLTSTITDTVSAGLANRAVAKVWNEIGANSPKDSILDNLDLVAKKKAHDTASTDLVFASIDPGDALAITLV